MLKLELKNVNSKISLAKSGQILKAPALKSSGLYITDDDSHSANMKAAQIPQNKMLIMFANVTLKDLFGQILSS